MPGLTGLQLAEHIPANTQFIFCTAFNSFALDAFELNAVDYLLKPIAPERLAKALQKLRSANDGAAQHFLAEQHGILLKFGDSQRVVRLNEISRFESIGNHAAVYTPYGKSFIHSSLAKIEQKLDPALFFKASRADIVRISAISHIEPAIADGGLIAVLQDGQQVDVSRRQAQQLKQQLVLAHQQSQQLRQELQQLKQQRLLDPLTGLYNRLAMQNQLDLWFSEQPDRRIAAIAVNLDHFNRFNQQFGSTIGDVILSKVARKISSYVQSSGLPVRSGGEEFLILLPDVDLRSASEIAEQVRRGVEKLRFVSSRSKTTLPKVTISLGVSLFQHGENWYQFLGRTAQVLQLAKQRGRNQVASESMLPT